MAKKVKNEPQGNPQEYFVFARYFRDEAWTYLGSKDDVSAAEELLEQRGEAENVEYKVIKGIELHTEEDIAIFPYRIIEKE